MGQDTYMNLIIHCLVCLVVIDNLVEATLLGGASMGNQSMRQKVNARLLHAGC